MPRTGSKADEGTFKLKSLGVDKFMRLPLLVQHLRATS
nr:MAG TPA: hypothetical protein [Caudoviricetes sp.]